MGFEIADGPEVETDYYNFEALNIPKDHPAGYPGYLLYQREYPAQNPDLSGAGACDGAEKASDPDHFSGRVYRSDALDATHSPLFHQIEGLVVDKGITFADLKGTLETFIKAPLRRGLRGSVPSPSLFPLPSLPPR